jgi:hypothetical protein
MRLTDPTKKSEVNSGTRDGETIHASPPPPPPKSPIVLLTTKSGKSLVGDRGMKTIYSRLRRGYYVMPSSSL